MIRRAVSLAALALAACSFDPRPIDPGDGTGPDARDRIDAPPGSPDAVDEPDAGDTADAQSGCPIEYVPLGASTTLYKVVDDTLSYAEAETDCNDDDDAGFTRFTHLAVIGDEVERLAIVPLFTGNRWVGLTDATTEGTWAWVTNEPTGGYEVPGNLPTPWDTGEPNGDDTTDCVRFKNSKLFDDRACGEVNKYLCECDQHPPH